MAEPKAEDHPPMDEKDVLRLILNGWDYERAKGIVQNYNDARAGWLGKKNGQ
jgi:hypothetical protein